jgi:hypothetical protein
MRAKERPRSQYYNLGLLELELIINISLQTYVVQKTHNYVDLIATSYQLIVQDQIN